MDVLIAEFEQNFMQGQPSCSITLGIPWSPASFIGAARLLHHPFDEHGADDGARRAAFMALTLGCKELNHRRRAYIERWTARSEELRSAEEQLHQRLHPEVREVLRGKRLLLLKEMLAEIRIPNLDAFFEILTQGCHLVGELPASGLFAARPREAATSARN